MTRTAEEKAEMYRKQLGGMTAANNRLKQKLKGFEKLKGKLVPYLAEREEELTEKARELEMELWDEPADREEFGWKLDELLEEAEKVRKLREELETL